ncbi:MAG: hypothetical protein ACFE9Z_15385 [Promethearchaeota archaeon]
MESIKNNLRDNEIIKWEKSKIINYRKRIVRSFVISFSLITLFMTLIGLFFWYAPSWGGTFYFLWTDIVVHPLIIYILILSIFVSVAIFAVIYAIKLFKRGLNRLGLKLADLNEYQQVHMLTNERWIQKDYRSLVYSGNNRFPDGAVTQINDFVYIYLNNIEKATISRIRSNYNISFHFKRIFGLDQNRTFDVKFKLNEYQELKSLLTQIFPLEILKE